MNDLIHRYFKPDWSIPNASEWNYPTCMPLDMLSLKETAEVVQIFLGKRVISSISRFCLRSTFQRARGYEYIEEWKADNRRAAKPRLLQRLRGDQILWITNKLREYGHNNR